MASIREFIESQEGDLEIGENESLKFPFNIPKSWQSDPHNPSLPVFILEDDEGTDVTSSFVTGEPTVVPGLYNTPLIAGLTKRETYKMICQWKDTPNTLEAFGWLRCT